MNREKARVAVYALGGAYLIYLAWQLFTGMPEAGSERILSIVFMILFALIGAAALVWGLYMAWKQIKEFSQLPYEAEEEEEKEQE